MIVGASSKRSPFASASKEQVQNVPQEELFRQYIFKSIETRDYSAASTFIDFITQEMGHKFTKELYLWKGYSLFHLGEYSEAITIYEQLLQSEPDDTVLNLFISSCYFYLRQFEEARIYAQKGPNCDFQIRLLFHIAHQMNNEEEVHLAHSKLVGTLENQLCLASIHYMRSHYQEAIDIYQKLLLKQPELVALNVYIAMCLFKLDQFQESNDYTDVYLQDNSDSAVALNLKSCDDLRLFDPDVAESQLLQIPKFSSASYSFINILIQHNLCIFQDGEGGFKTLPPLVDSLPEARYNLAVLYMRKNNPTEAYHLLENFQPMDISESILKADVFLAISQLTGDPGPLAEAQATFSEIGETQIVCDTVPGRQCLASAKFILNDYNETLHVLSTIETQVGDLDEFNYNKAMSLALLSRWAEAEKHFLKVQNEYYKKESFYQSWLCRCYIKNKKPDEAWKLYIESTTTEDAKILLQIIAHDCFVSSEYYYAMKAYDILCKCDVDPTYKEGLIASAIGVFQSELMSDNLNSDNMSEVITALSSEEDAKSVLETIEQFLESSQTLNNQMEY